MLKITAPVKALLDIDVFHQFYCFLSRDPDWLVFIRTTFIQNFQNLLFVVVYLIW